MNDGNLFLSLEEDSRVFFDSLESYEMPTPLIPIEELVRSTPVVPYGRSRSLGDADMTQYLGDGGSGSSESDPQGMSLSEVWFPSSLAASLRIESPHFFTPIIEDLNPMVNPSRNISGGSEKVDSDERDVDMGSYGSSYEEKSIEQGRVSPTVAHLSNCGVGSGLRYQKRPPLAALSTPIKPPTPKRPRPQRTLGNLERAASSPELDRYVPERKPQAGRRVIHIMDNHSPPPGGLDGTTTSMAFGRHIIMGPIASEGVNGITAIFGDYYLRLGHNGFIVSDTTALHGARPLEVLQQCLQFSPLSGAEAEIVVSISGVDRLALQVTGQTKLNVALLRVEEDGYYRPVMTGVEDLVTEGNVQVDDLVILTYSRLNISVFRVHSSINLVDIAQAFLDACGTNERFVMIAQIVMRL